jgi:type IV secretory pathway TraG/TraD family ATPase VirD4
MSRIPPKPGNQFLPIVIGGTTLVVILYLTHQLGTFFSTGSFTGGWPHLVVIDMLLGMVKQTYSWTTAHTVILVLLFLLMFVGSFIGVTLWSGRTKKSDAYRASKHMSQGEEMSEKQVAKRSISGRLTSGEITGALIAQTMKGARRIADWRSTVLIIMGPGAGKTVGEAIPLIMDAPGVVFATTNKRDLPDAIRGAKDGRVWVFDPERITIKEHPPWRLELSDYVRDEVRAHKLAKIWMDASGPANAKRDAYFDSAGPNLLAGLLLASALSYAPISQMYRWLMKPKNREPIRILNEHKKFLPALALESVYDAPDEQRAGVFGTAAEMVSFLANPRVLEWLETYGPEDERPLFCPEKFVRSGDETMIALSKEGIGSTGPLTAALTVWVLDAAEEFADEHEHGRLPIPLVVVLDEAANVCRIQELPNLYSHYGSRGIFPVTILQTWAQGVRVWGEDGMKALWGASTVRIIGAGQADTSFLKMISELIGDHYVREHSVSSGGQKGTRSSSHSLRPIMTVDELGALKGGEVVVHVSGDKPFMGKTLPWFQRPEMAPRVSASIAEFEPKSLTTV